MRQESEDGRQGRETCDRGQRTRDGKRGHRWALPIELRYSVLTTFRRIFAKLMSCLRSYCAVGVPADANTVVAGLPYAVDAVMM